ncbi:hypothetical protein BJL83_23560 [Vibrio parahaemolyticus]|nr:hypothetical protein BJL83_23560 [Vibrio parahaemolyticus]
MPHWIFKSVGCDFLWLKSLQFYLFWKLIYWLKFRSENQPVQIPCLRAELPISLVVWLQWVSEIKSFWHLVFNQIQRVAYVSLFPKSGFLIPIPTNCVKRLTKHLRVTHNAWRFQFKLSFSV